MASREKKTPVAAERDRETIVAARAWWKEHMWRVDPAKLVFIDESGFNTKMTRLMGRCPRGLPCYGAVPYGYWGSNTFIAALRMDRIDAPMLIPGAMNGDAFVVWVEQELAPTLSPGDIVVCDNLSVHKNAMARKAIEDRGAELCFLPAYSPDLNPIEMLFSKIKALVRGAEARCFDTLCTAIKEALDAVAPRECSNYLAHAGYAPT